MATHRQPESGYISNEKQKYREKVWDSFSKTWAIDLANRNENAYILILPGLTCDEIDTAVKYGINPKKIICVHESAAHVAKSAEWRVKYKDTPFYCCKISELRNKLIKDRRYLVGANFDFCNNLSGELIEELDSILNPAVIHPIFAFQVNMMKGRESKTVTSIMNILKNRQHFCYNSKKDRMPDVKDIRLTSLLDLIGLHERFGCSKFNVLHEDTYINNKVPMVHCCVSLINDRWLYRRYEETDYIFEVESIVQSMIIDDIYSMFDESSPFSDDEVGIIKLDIESVQREAEFVCSFIDSIDYTTIDEIKRSKLYKKDVSDFDKPKNRHHLWYKEKIESGELSEVAEKYKVVVSLINKMLSDNKIYEITKKHAKKTYGYNYRDTGYKLNMLFGKQINRIINPNDFKVMSISEFLRVNN